MCICVACNVMPLTVSYTQYKIMYALFLQIGTLFVFELVGF